MMTNRIKAQGKSHKVRGTRFFPCTLHLVPCTSRLASPAFQHGFSLVSAIFLLVVIAALGTFAVTLSTTQQQSAALDVLGSRAYQAARAGIEWGAYQVLPASAVSGFATTCRTTGAAGPQLIAALPNTLAGFAVNVQCGATSVVEGTNTVWVYNLTSTATQGAVATPNYVERAISVTIAQ
jgi:MSHA biogenesis protein MshP